MLSLKILKSKKRFIKSTGEILVDLISSTFRFDNVGSSTGIVIVQQGEDMRPDLVANRLYGDQNAFDALLKYNGISNPFSIKEGDVLYALPYGGIGNLFGSPNEVAEKGKPKTNELEKTFIDPKTTKDKKRLDSIKTKVNTVVPPNVNKPGDKNIKVKDGRVIFGEDVTSVNKDNCPVPISRARLQQALLKNKLFI